MSENEKTIGRPDYLARTWIEDGQARTAERIVADLLRLQSETDPRDGESSAVDKDEKARKALGLADELTRYLAGWAMDHIAGKSVSGLDHAFRQPVGQKDHPDHLGLKASVDQHEHERLGNGASSQYPLPNFDTAAIRKCLINMSWAGMGAVPETARQTLRHALVALSYGETLPLFQANDVGRAKRRYRIAQMELRGCQFAAFLIEAGGHNKAQSWTEVADAFGVTEDTARRWPAVLRKMMGTLEVSRAETFGKNRGSWVRQARDWKAGKDESTHSMARMGLEEFGPEALAAAGREYIALKRELGED